MSTEEVKDESKKVLWTANGLLPCSDRVIQHLHKENCKANGWNYTLLRHGTFGYDNLAMAYAAVSGTDTRDLMPLAEEVHKSWIKNYTYWRDQKPWLTNLVYRKPVADLGDERRDKCASTKFHDLDEVEQKKDLVIAQIILDMLKNWDEIFHKCD